jgi:hypothetical protein
MSLLNSWSPFTLSDYRTTWDADALEALLRSEHEKGHVYSSVLALVAIHSSNHSIERLYAGLAHHRMHWDYTNFSLLESESKNDSNLQTYRHTLEVLVFSRSRGLSAHALTLHTQLPKLRALAILECDFWTDADYAEFEVDSDDEEGDEQSLSTFSWFNHPDPDSNPDPDPVLPPTLRTLRVDKCRHIPSELYRATWTSAQDTLHFLTWTSVTALAEDDLLEFGVPSELRYLNVSNNSKLSSAIQQHVMRNRPMPANLRCLIIDLDFRQIMMVSLLIRAMPKLSILELHTEQKGLTKVSTQVLESFQKELDTHCQTRPFCLKLCYNSGSLRLYGGGYTESQCETLEQTLNEKVRVAEVPEYGYPEREESDVDSGMGIEAEVNDSNESVVPVSQYRRLLRQCQFYRNWLIQLGQDPGDMMIGLDMDALRISSPSSSPITHKSVPVEVVEITEYPDCSSPACMEDWMITYRWSNQSPQNICRWIWGEDVEPSVDTTRCTLDDEGCFERCNAFLSTTPLAYRYAVCKQLLASEPVLIDDRTLWPLFPRDIFGQMIDIDDHQQKLNQKDYYCHAFSVVVPYINRLLDADRVIFMCRLNDQLECYASWFRRSDADDDELLQSVNVHGGVVESISGHLHQMGKKISFESSPGIILQSGNVVFSAQYVVNGKSKKNVPTIEEYKLIHVRWMLHVMGTWFLLNDTFTGVADLLGGMTGLKSVADLLDDPDVLVHKVDQRKNEMLVQTVVEWKDAFIRLRQSLREAYQSGMED